MITETRFFIFYQEINTNYMQEHDQLYKMRHSLAHLFAWAARDKFPGVKLAIGPVIDNGFYYDFDFSGTAITEADFEVIEKRMRGM
ncbi:MAG TPA: hypothetical protein PLJ58_03985, partial [bacterium]|nr:hypothetical protein [bacterium]